MVSRKNFQPPYKCFDGFSDLNRRKTWLRYPITSASVLLMISAKLEARNTGNVSNSTVTGKYESQLEMGRVISHGSYGEKTMMISSAPDCFIRLQQQPTGACRRVSSPVEKTAQVLIVNLIIITQHAKGSIGRDEGATINFS